MTNIRIFLWLFVLIGLLSVTSAARASYRSLKVSVKDKDRSLTANGGGGCLVCTMAIAVIQQYAQIHYIPAGEAFPNLCKLLPEELQGMCLRTAHFLEDALEYLFVHKLTPDVICHVLRFCHVDKGKQMCHLFPKPKLGLRQSVDSFQMEIRDKLPSWYFESEQFSPCDLPGIKQFCKFFDRVYHKREPAFDDDGDLFSTVQTYRGSTWRGKDCNDFDSEIYPGRKPLDSDREVDSNCNGIHGINPKTNKPFEDELCSGIDTYGLLIISDSTGAHFHLPPEWLTAAKITKGIYKNFTYWVTNEADWPHLSFFTGYENSTWPIVNGTTDSLYFRMRERNLCIHRDFQNLAQNGEKATDFAKYLPSIGRNRTTDKPFLVIHAMTGNDVCNGYHDTLEHTTPPEEFRTSILETLLYLDRNVPQGSHVVFLGLPDGSIMWEANHNVLHPLGELNHDVTIGDFYEWIWCLEIGCHGWQTPNATLRQLLTEKAEALSAIMKDITVKYKFASFTMHYIEHPAQAVFDKWKAEGHQVSELFEPADGLHLNQMAQALTGKELYEALLKCCPEVLGSVNPNNDLIRSLFGDQGGY